MSFDSTPNNHGTGVAGIVIDCLYPAQVTVYDYDVGYYDESDKEDKLMDESCLLTCIKAAADDGADVINCSFGGYVSKEVFRSAIEYAISKGSLAVCAAGNDNADMSSYYPAALSYLDGCVAVSAGDSNGQKASFTNYGKGVELMAPGKQVFSCLANTTDQAKITDGTSLAAPHVSAAAALLKIATGVKTAAELEKLLLTATTSSGKNWIDKYYGYGFLDLDEAAVVPVTLQSGMSLANVTITDADGRQLYPVVVKTVAPPPPATVTVVPPPTVNPSPTNVTAASPSTSGTAKLTSTCTSKPKTGTTYVIESKLGNVWLNVANGTKKSGTNVQILNKRTAAAQKWSLVSAGSGYCYIKSALGNYYLSVQGSKAANKANVQICSSKTNAQKWTFAIYKK